MADKEKPSIKWTLQVMTTFYGYAIENEVELPFEPDAADIEYLISDFRYSVAARLREKLQHLADSRDT